MGKTFIVEHLDPELGPWSELEYIAIAKETRDSNGQFILSSLPSGFLVPDTLSGIAAFTPERRGVEELYAGKRDRVCLLDPAAAQDLSPADGEMFDAFLFGGILGRVPSHRLATFYEFGYRGSRKLTLWAQAMILPEVCYEKSADGQEREREMLTMQRSHI